MSIRKKVFNYLKQNPNADNNELYEIFEDFNQNTLRVYRQQFLDNCEQNITFNIFRENIPEETKKECDFDTFEAILNNLNLFPAFIFHKLYWKTKKTEEYRDKNYSLVNIYNDLFNQIITGKFNFEEISDFIYNCYDKLEEVYLDIENRSQDALNSDKKINEKVLRKIWKSLEICRIIRKNLLGKFLYLRNGNYREFETKRDREKTYSDLVRFVKIYILSEYILVDLYTNAPHLLDRNPKYIFRDLKKTELWITKTHRINGKYLRKSERIELSNPINQFNDIVSETKSIEVIPNNAYNERYLPYMVEDMNQRKQKELKNRESN